MTAWRLAAAITLAAAACAQPPSSPVAPTPTAVGGLNSPIPAVSTARPAPTETRGGCVEDGGELRFQSGATTVRGPIVKPEGSGPFPAALVLHTRAGLNAHAVSEATWFASQGILAYAPDYFTPLGVTPLSFDRQTFTAKYTDTATDLLARAAECLRARAEVDPARVGAIGFSIGGYLALVLATRPGIAAAAGWYAAYGGAPVNQVPGPDWTTIARSVRAPVLLLHGEADADVRVDFARRAQAELERANKTSQLIVYPGVGHGYDQQGGVAYTYDPAATADSRARTVALLRAVR